MDKWVSELQICTKLGKQTVNDILYKQERIFLFMAQLTRKCRILEIYCPLLVIPLQGKPEQLEKTKQNPLWICTMKLFWTKLISALRTSHKLCLQNQWSLKDESSGDETALRHFTPHCCVNKYLKYANKSGEKTPKLKMANGHFIKFNSILVLRQMTEYGTPAI